jgi:centromere protein V
MLSLAGSCHCSFVRFTFRVHDFEGSGGLQVTDCSCTVCMQKGFRHVDVPNRADFKLVSPATMDLLSLYTFGTHTARHYFCPRCGVQSFYVPRSNPSGYSVNLNCISTPYFVAHVVQFDGRNNYEQELERFQQQVHHVNVKVEVSSDDDDDDDEHEAEQRLCATSSSSSSTANRSSGDNCSDDSDSGCDSDGNERECSSCLAKPSIRTLRPRCTACQRLFCARCCDDGGLCSRCSQGVRITSSPYASPGARLGEIVQCASCMAGPDARTLSRRCSKCPRLLCSRCCGQNKVCPLCSSRARKTRRLFAFDDESSKSTSPPQDSTRRSENQNKKQNRT